MLRFKTICENCGATLAVFPYRRKVTCPTCKMVLFLDPVDHTGYRMSWAMESTCPNKPIPCIGIVLGWIVGTMFCASISVLAKLLWLK